MLVAHRNQPLSIIFDSAAPAPATAATCGRASWPRWGSSDGRSWAFESAGAIAEEVQDAKRNVPKAIVAALVAIGAVVLFSRLALIVATPDLAAAVSGQ